ncbi:hypothetical protein VTK73DRAFT_8018 [Phialemonium thermophilum]|uniref:NmrA-like domain-containing protein n=1 Tax=Phialemonium thermophilum TaxID=223376 RepID=A0ABR3XQ77_9PEZI
MALSSVLVVGAGELGSAVLYSLSQHPNHFSLSSLLRPSSIASSDPTKVAELDKLRSWGVRLVAGDLANDTEESLGEIFRRFDLVIGCAGFVNGPGTQLKLTRSVLAAGVRFYIPWQFGVDYDAIGRGSAHDLFDEQLDVRDLLRSQQRTRWTIISTGMFTSFLFEPAVGIVDLAVPSVRALGSWETEVTVTSPEDIGRITAEVAARPDTFSNRPIYIAGDTLTYAALADIVGRLTGRPVTRSLLTVEMAQADLKKDPENTLLKYYIVFGQGRGVAWDKSKTWNIKMGIPLLGAEEWARQHLDIKRS